VGHRRSTGRAVTSEIATVALDLATNVFQLHGADASGRAVLRRKLRRGQVLEVLAGLPRCTVAMEACGGAHFWGREIEKLGHEVRLLPPAYVKPLVRRQKNDAADAEAICEAAQRPNMRFMAVKSEEKQGAAAVFSGARAADPAAHADDTINALRGPLTEFGEIVSQGAWTARRLAELVEAEDDALPKAARATLRILVDGSAISTSGSPSSTRRSPAGHGRTTSRGD
jgi:transposase